jgi:DNA-binding beta-propeller fold protein YncE
MDSNDELMEKLVLDGTGQVSTIKDLAGMSGVGIAYDAKAKKIYFSDFYDEVTPDGKIWRMNLDGSGAEVLVSGLLNPYGIALDVAGNKIYWAGEDGHVGRVNLDGSSADTGFIYIPDGKIRAVTIDKPNNKLYFFEVNTEVLYSANLDGTNVTPLITGVYGYSIAVDQKNKKIYFDDQNTPGLRRANMDGTGIVDIASVDSRIFGLEVDPDFGKVYWSARSMGEIYKANLNGTEVDTLVTGLTSPRGLFLFR